MIARIFVAGLLGALAMFVWTFVAHMVLPLGSTGFSQLPNEAQATSAMQASAGDKGGLYIFPWIDPAAMKAKGGMAAYTAKAKAGPSGLLLYRPPGSATTVDPATLLQEFVKQLVVCVIAAFLVAEAKLARLWERVGFVAAIGAVAALETNASYRIWYGFPVDFTAAAILSAFVSYVVAGLAIGGWLKPPKPATP